MYLYLPSAIIASKSLPKVSSEKVFLNSSTILADSGWEATSSSSSSTSFTAWKREFSTFCPSNAILQSLIRCIRLPPSKTVVPFLAERLAWYALFISSSIPFSLRAEILTTGSPIFFSSSSAFILSPFFSTASIIFKAMTTGTSISIICVVRYKLRSRLVASTMLITQSGFSSRR